MESYNHILYSKQKESTCFGRVSSAHFQALMGSPLGPTFIGSPLGSTLVNAFLVHFEKNWLQKCPSDFKPLYYRWHLDDIFVSFTSSKPLEAFRNFLSG